MTTIGFLGVPEHSAEAQRLFDDDLAELGYVMNATRLWAYQPGTMEDLFALMHTATSPHRLTFRQRGILVLACASTLGDAPCSLAWGVKLADDSGADIAAAVLNGDDTGLTGAERALAAWARMVTRDPNGIARADVRELGEAGWTDRQIFAITVFVALRQAFSTVNDALGVHPDAAFRAAPKPVLDAVTYGRPIDEPEAS